MILADMRSNLFAGASDLLLNQSLESSSFMSLSYVLGEENPGILTDRLTAARNVRKGICGKQNKPPPHEDTHILTPRAYILPYKTKKDFKYVIQLGILT